MAYVIKGAMNPIGYTPINATVPDTTKTIDLGTIVTGVDPLYGMGEFIYLAGVAGTVVGSVVNFDQVAGTTTLNPATGGNGQVAVAMAATVATTFGWYQVRGVAVVKDSGTATVGADAFAQASTPGSISSASVPSEQVVNAKFVSAINTPSAGLALCQIEYPFMQGAIT
jgi:hypothetical protein